LLAPNHPAYNFDVIAGVTYGIDVTRPARYTSGGKLLDRSAGRIIDLRFQGRPIDPKQDFVVVTNAELVKLTGNKTEQKFYFRHTGYNNGAKVVPFKRQMANDPTKVVELAVKRMLDDNRLRAHRMRRLKVFKGPEHTYPVAKPKAAKTAKTA